MERKPDEGLKREIGVMDVAINAVNNIVGAGIFLLPALIAASIGNAAILAYIICAVMLFAVMLCFAEASSRVTTTGGAYAYIENAFGPYAGFVTNSLYWFGAGILSDAALANGMLDLVSIQFPLFHVPVYRAICFFILFGGFAIINIRGVKQGMEVIRISTILKLLPLILLIVTGFFTVKFHNLEWQGFPSFKHIGEASLILFFAFMGGDTAVIISGEMKNPKRTGPLGILSGVSIIVVFYILIQLVAQGTLGADLQNHKDAPLAVVAQIAMGHIGVTLLTIGAIVSIFGNISSSPLLFSRLIFAAAEDKLLPAFLSKVHSKFATPYMAILIYCAFDFIFSVSGGFKQLVILCTASTLLIYFGVVLSIIKFRLKKNRGDEDIFKIPGGLTVPTIAIVILSWFLAHLSFNEIWAVGIFMLVVSGIYFCSNFLQKKKVVHNL